MAGSLWAWNVFFNYGLFGNLSTAANFKNTQRVVVISLVALLGALILHREIRIRTWTLFAFAPAILLVLLRLLAPAGTPGAARPRVITEGVFGVIEGVLIVATVVVAPLVVWVALRLLAPKFFVLPGRRTKIGVVVIVAIISLLAYSVGRWNYRFLTCEDFTAANQKPPPSCVKAEK